MADDIFVLIEHTEGKVSDISFEMLGRGRGLAAATGGKLVAVLLGARSLADQLGAADTVLCVEHPALQSYNPEAYRHALAAVAKERAPRVLLIGSTVVGLDLAPGLSVELEWPVVAYAREVSLADGELSVTSQIYGGKINASASVPGEHAIVAVLAGSAPAEAGQMEGSPVVEDVEAPATLGSLRVRFKKLILPEAGDVDITKETTLVAVGRGIESQDNISLVEELAEALGAAVAASRPIVDQGWLPKTRQVGKSGMTVKPKLYIAVGISGAPEHLEGMRSSATIVAINTDETAPIFDVAHYGIAGDLFDVLPALTEKLAGS